MWLVVLVGCAEPFDIDAACSETRDEIRVVVETQEAQNAVLGGCETYSEPLCDTSGPTTRSVGDQDYAEIRWTAPCAGSPTLEMRCEYALYDQGWTLELCYAR